jgi:hypothetical protein
VDPVGSYEHTWDDCGVVPIRTKPTTRLVSPLFTRILTEHSSSDKVFVLFLGSDRTPTMENGEHSTLRYVKLFLLSV